MAGKEEKWRRALQEMAVIRLEVEDPFEAISALAGSEDTFGRWLKRRIEEFHGVDVAHARCNTVPELVFHSGPEDEA